MILYNFLHGGLSHNGPILEPFESIQGGIRVSILINDGRSIVDTMPTVIVKRLILDCSMTTSTTITCTPSYFRRRYHMRMTLFLSIIYKLSEISLYFSERYDVTDRIG
jgi:hypothetical protein